MNVLLQFHLSECELSEADRCHNVISMQGSSNCSTASSRIFMQILSVEQRERETEREGEGERERDDKKWFIQKEVDTIQR